MACDFREQIRNRHFWKQKEFCDEFHLLDLRSLDNCLKVSAGVDWVFNLAADMVVTQHNFFVLPI
jgi:GDP-D-mannose 3',5'-epimerase